METENHLLIKSFRQTLISNRRNKKRQANPENKQTIGGKACQSAFPQVGKSERWGKRPGKSWESQTKAQINSLIFTNAAPSR